MFLQQGFPKDFRRTVGGRIRILKAMRDRAQKRIIRQYEINMELKDRVNRELGQKVMERTLQLNTKNEELEAINRKLERQSAEINQINSMLDLDNWGFRRKVVERMHGMESYRTNITSQKGQGAPHKWGLTAGPLSHFVCNHGVVIFSLLLCFSAAKSPNPLTGIRAEIV